VDGYRDSSGVLHNTVRSKRTADHKSDRESEGIQSETNAGCGPLPSLQTSPGPLFRPCSGGRVHSAPLEGSLSFPLVFSLRFPLHFPSRNDFRVPLVGNEGKKNPPDSFVSDGRSAGQSSERRVWITHLVENPPNPREWSVRAGPSSETISIEPAGGVFGSL